LTIARNASSSEGKFGTTNIPVMKDSLCLARDIALSKPLKEFLEPSSGTKILIPFFDMWFEELLVVLSFVI
jgi:hypothetical protein